MKIDKNFFERSADVVAQELLGKILIRKINGEIFRTRIVETEAYFGEDDSASRASKENFWLCCSLLKNLILFFSGFIFANFVFAKLPKGKNKISEMMWEGPGKILVYNVHMYKMFNFITYKKGVPSAVLIRAVEPLNFNLRCCGPGLLTNSLKINKSIHGKNIFDLEDLELENSEDKFDIVKSFKIGVTKDLEKPMRFYIKNNCFVSKK